MGPRDPGNAKVGDFHGSVRTDEDVAGLDIPVHDVLSVRVLDGLAHLHHQPHGFL